MDGQGPKIIPALAGAGVAAPTRGQPRRGWVKGA
jgi:hypothetical protein